MLMFSSGDAPQGAWRGDWIEPLGEAYALLRAAILCPMWSDRSSIQIGLSQPYSGV
jgi:hypothetical protein